MKSACSACQFSVAFTSVLVRFESASWHHLHSFSVLAANQAVGADESSLGVPGSKKGVRTFPEQSWPRHQMSRVTLPWTSGSGCTSPKFQSQVAAGIVSSDDGSMRNHCPSCGTTFSSDSELFDHMRGVHKVYVCIPCKQAFSSFANFSYHRNKQHGHNVDLQCSHCGKFFGHRQNLRQHLRKTHKDFTLEQKKTL